MDVLELKLMELCEVSVVYFFLWVEVFFERKFYREDFRILKGFWRGFRKIF